MKSIHSGRGCPSSSGKWRSAEDGAAALLMRRLRVCREVGRWWGVLQHTPPRGPSATFPLGSAEGRGVGALPRIERPRDPRVELLQVVPRRLVGGAGEPSTDGGAERGEFPAGVGADVRLAHVDRGARV